MSSKLDVNKDITEKTILIDRGIYDILQGLMEEDEVLLNVLLGAEIREEIILVYEKGASLLDIPLPNNYIEDVAITIQLGIGGEHDLQYLAEKYNVSEGKMIAMITYHLDKSHHYFSNGTMRPCHRKKCRLKKVKIEKIPVYQ